MILRLWDKLSFKFAQRGLRKYLALIGFVDQEVLDVGCGEGHFSKLFTRNYFGIDTDFEAIKKARNRYPHGYFEVMNADQLNFPDKKFALVFTTSVLHHLNDDEVIKVIREMARVTKDGGHILITDMILPTPFKFLAYPIFYFDEGSRSRTFGQLERLLSKIGLTPRFKRYRNHFLIGSAVFEYQK